MTALLALDEALEMLARDDQEGREDVNLTRPAARALYFAAWDALHAEGGREHTDEDRHRLDLALTTLGSIGWPG